MLEHGHGCLCLDHSKTKRHDMSLSEVSGTKFKINAATVQVNVFMMIFRWPYYVCYYTSIHLIVFLHIQKYLIKLKNCILQRWKQKMYFVWYNCPSDQLSLSYATWYFLFGLSFFFDNSFSSKMEYMNSHCLWWISLTGLP